MTLASIAACIVAAFAFICMAGLAHAQQDYPVKPITLLIPFPPGTGNGVVGCIVGNKLTEYLGQRVVADNRAARYLCDTDLRPVASRPANSTHECRHSGARPKRVRSRSARGGAS